MKFESKIAAFLDTHLLFAWDAGTKQLIVYKWVIGTVNSSHFLLVSTLQRVLKDLVAEKLPLVAAHFATLNFDLTLFAFSWFLTLFVDNIPVETYLRIWDAFMYEGSKVLIALFFF